MGIAGLEAQAAGLPTLASANVIPEDIAVTDLLHFVPLEEGPAAWADRVLSMLKEAEPRPESLQDPLFKRILDEFTEKGYNSAAEVKRLEQLLAGEN